MIGERPGIGLGDEFPDGRVRLGRTVSETTSPQTNPKLPEVKYIDDPALHEDVGQVHHPEGRAAGARRERGDLLDDLQRKRLYISVKEIRRLERAQAQDTPPPSHWG